MRKNLSKHPMNFHLMSGMRDESTCKVKLYKNILDFCNRFRLNVCVCLYEMTVDFCVP